MAVAQNTTFPSEPISYYNGNSRTTINVALDELQVTNPANLQSLQTRGTARPDGENGARLRLSAPASSMSTISQTAAPLNAGNQRAHAVAYPQGQTARIDESALFITDRIHFKAATPGQAQSLATRHGLQIVRTMKFDPKIVEARVSSTDLLASVTIANALYESGDVEFAQPVLERELFTRLIPNDPLFFQQWHLLNNGTGNSFDAGNDINVVPAWNRLTGAGVNIQIVDSGVLNTHPDLAPNARLDIDYDYIDDDDNSTANVFHGTAVSGVAAAAGNNGQGVTGVAFNADIVGVRLVGGSTSDAQIADALAHNVNQVVVTDQAHISNNSWGPSDSSPTVKELLPPIVEAAIVDGITNGRNGKGVIYVWAAGNGRQNNQDISFDGYAASRYTIAVGATGGQGTIPFYTEPGASLLINAPSSFGSFAITTTGGSNSYTSNFTGTSSSAPTAAGVIALMLEENPSLTWRDVQQILVMSSTKTDVDNPGWIQNGGGFLFSHDYGYGRINADDATKIAATWDSLPNPLPSITDSLTALNLAIPDNNPNGVTSTINVTPNSAFSVEHVEVFVRIVHPSRGQLNISLTAPSGMRSVFTETHADSAADYSNYQFTSVAHWGEDPTGDWTLNISDGTFGQQGTLIDWTLGLHGTIPLSQVNPGPNVPSLKVPFFDSQRN